MKQGSSVTVVTRLREVMQRNRASISMWARDFSLSSASTSSPWSNQPPAATVILSTELKLLVRDSDDSSASSTEGKMLRFVPLLLYTSSRLNA